MNTTVTIPREIRRRRLALGLGASVAVLAFALLGAYLTFRASLPRLDGEVAVPGLKAVVTIERDVNGVPTVRARNRLDLARATGYVHAQDRFFQMDLQRRLSAGELSELLGPATLPTDRSLRRHQFSRVADQVLEQATPAERDLLDAYAEGVNQALRDLGARSWEYLPLGASPRPWKARDSLLVAFAMYIDLNDTTGERELANAALRATLPAELFSVLYPLGSEWDAPVDGGTWRAPPLPGPEVLDLRQGARRMAALAVPRRDAMTDMLGDAALGSNSWAVGGAQTSDGRALLANDMHLGLQVPNIWYRARLLVATTEGTLQDLIGVTLPGLPIMVAGSNTHVAWGFTNTHGDWTDLVVVNVDPADATKYLTSEGPMPFEHEAEVIAVRGQLLETLSLTRTQWGPVVAMDATGRPLVLAWTAHRPEATNLKMLGFETAGTVQEALRVASESGAPVQNVVVADSSGSIGWTLFGQIPVRQGYDSRFPSDWSKPATGWIRWRTPDEIPRIVNPLGGRLWTANSRTITATTWLDFVGPGAYVLGARAGQIRDDLLAQKSADAKGMVAIQLDDRALFLARWRDLLLQVLTPTAVQGNQARQVARRLVEGWSGHAAVDDPGYLIVRNFRRAVLSATFDALVAPTRIAYPEIKFDPGQQFEGSAWRLVTERPLHLLDPNYPDWDGALVAWLDVALADIKKECGTLSDCGWGRTNVLSMRHPLSRAMPWASWLIDMPSMPLPGDSNMPRVQGPRQGASERLVVSPGRESEGFFQMPGGQSSHPLSAYYRAGHDAWITGQPQPLLPGPATHTLTLRPPAAP
ncbi:MAG: penicillin acylase family protein [Steroidobacteraceae bacterium]